MHLYAGRTNVIPGEKGSSTLLALLSTGDCYFDPHHFLVQISDQRSVYLDVDTECGLRKCSYLAVIAVNDTQHRKSRELARVATPIRVEIHTHIVPADYLLLRNAQAILFERYSSKLAAFNKQTARTDVFETRQFSRMLCVFEEP